MNEIAATDSPLEAAARTVGIDTTDALELLADETRLAILLALWEEHEPHADDAVPFSRLFDRVDYDNRGNFSYHLEKLEGQFVTQHTERGGYELRTSGLKFVRSLIAGTGLDDISVTDAEIGEPCPICGAPTAVNYHDGVVLWTCTECNGVAPGVSEWGDAEGPHGRGAWIRAVRARGRGRSDACGTAGRERGGQPPEGSVYVRRALCDLLGTGQGPVRVLSGPRPGWSL